MMDLVQNTLNRFVSSGQIAGCSARIMRNDEVCFEGHFGYADIEKKIPISDNTIFPIASMSKVITVAGIMQLYEQGLFKLWDPVSEYLPGFKQPKIAEEKPDGSYEITDAKGEITMRQLFTMTSGVPYPGNDTAAARIRTEKEKDFQAQGKPEPETVEYCNLVGQLPLAFEPGESIGSTLYSSGTVADNCAVCRRPYRDHVSQRIQEDQRAAASKGPCY